MRAMALVLLMFISSPLFAQSNSEKETNYSIGVFGGRFLPYDIYGVRDVYPYWGLRIGHRIWGIEPEYSAFFISALGVNMTNLSAAIAFPFELEGWKYRPFLGADMYYYRGHTNLRELPYANTFGFDLGISPEIEITARLLMRVDFKMGFGPGKTLAVDGGLEFKF